MAIDRVCPYCGQAITTDEIASRIREAERVRAEQMKQGQKQAFDLEIKNRETSLKNELIRTFEHERQDLLGRASRLSELLEKSNQAAQAERQKREKEFETRVEEIKRAAVEEAGKNAREETDKERHHIEEKLISTSHDLESTQAELRGQVEQFNRREKEFTAEIKGLEEKIREDSMTKARAESEQQLKHMEIEIERLKLASEQERIRLQKQVEDLNRRLEKKSAEELGRVPEEELERLLREQFPGDAILHIGRGKAGGDLVQTVFVNGTEAGKIVYEVKNTLAWSNDFVEQAKKHRTTYKTPYVILVSRVFPANERDFTERDGILVVTADKASVVARILRQSIVDLSRERAAGSEVQSKASELYEFLRSADFQERLRAIFDSIERLRRLQEQEQRAHTRHWESQAKEHTAIHTHMSGIEGRISSIIEGQLIHIPVPKRTTKEEESQSSNSSP